MREQLNRHKKVQGHKAVMIAGTHSGVGKTTVTMGIMAALSQKMSVQGFKVGPDYIDTAYHTFITGAKSRNLDNYLMDDPHVIKSFIQAMAGKDMGVIEGAMGLFDGSLADPERGSSASVSKVIGCPIILVIDGSGMSLSVAALLKGYCDFDPSVHIAGVIINRVNSLSHYEILKKAIETQTKVACLGYLPKSVPQLPSRHLGLVPSCEIEDLEKKVSELMALICKTIDLDAILNLSSMHEQTDEKLRTNTVLYTDAETSTDSALVKDCVVQPNPVIRVGIAYDEAFNFYYEDNIDFFREQGADIVFFSPLHQSSLPPDLDLLYFGGGYPEQFAKALVCNGPMRHSIYQQMASGIPYYAECGGFMYLNREIIDFEGKAHPMVGWFDGTVTMTPKLKGFGYKTLILQENCILGPKGLEINCHEFHHSEVSHMHLQPVFLLNKVRDSVVQGQNFCGYQKGNGVAGYPHLHFYGNEACPLNLLDAAKAYRIKRRSDMNSHG